MTFSEGIALGLIGCILTVVGFFIAFTLATKGEKTKEKQINEEKRLSKIFPNFNKK
jgi:hypothetical protein|tara:strand:+ start:436 stop:603 length:168 start_codon:yes stop_codon:yes gene_type:complete